MKHHARNDYRFSKYGDKRETRANRVRTRRCNPALEI